MKLFKPQECVVLHILTVTAFAEKDFPDLFSNQQTNKPYLSAGESIAPLDH